MVHRHNKETTADSNFFFLAAPQTASKAREHTPALPFLLTLVPVQLVLRVQLGRIVVHDLLCKRDRVLFLSLGWRIWPGRRQRPCGFILYLDGGGEEVLDLAGADQPLVDGQGCANFLVDAYLDGVEQLQYVGLAVVADEVVGGLLLPDSLDYGLS